ncbi:MAG: phosphoribosylformylglycinamidine synthase I, phosphoribosylformylglycinamidine synthase [Candidatus Peregrinibacteria bacterium GW2011_GWF2_33_10]|nr:MAG: phosphoribosylformylglycinamidine synthase I, phosphoribosylformylglycinamidine synthase [Candidatus Peregrinibacteria bacterium GW2011_GWF2_33_10]OGJ45601.1 MAG: phosphoribosylformylglycinamidine synthase I [Candidatus Peregrinibacteria bacterium RIFOXYA2_FULL_33_21]OGJ46542.1 MAG: phosphoribosylformylglycinamidine synthase I [Candidatus Peregrinibacteria bacterium RIFOXYA12_FULL_33_12]OGJ51070.1 MAG: phosphoribosylformylglycinamidine synthase I [Candidatus Peregrinibacteria bacterium R
MKPKAAIIFSPGINRDQETSYALIQAGADYEIIQLIELEKGEKRLDDFQILLCPGGFSYGDDVMSAKIWASKSLAHFQTQLQKFISEDKLVIGICNGFQFLIRTGLLPFANVGQIEATLTHNASNHFECRWVNMKVQPSNCVFTKGMEGQILRMPTAHGEGRFLANDEALKRIKDQNQVIFRYVDENGNSTQDYPVNPNGSTEAIAGLCSPNGKIMGLMPHPECNSKKNHHPDWNIEGREGGECLRIFENAVKYFR